MSNPEERAAVAGAGDHLTIRGRKRNRPVQSAEDVQEKLRLAREKLKGAMQKRDRAMQRLSPANGSIASISALSTNLVIEHVSSTGPRDKVYFPTKTLGTDLGGTLLERDAKAMSIPNSLADRKARLQKELQLLKEKLEQHQKGQGQDESPFGSSSGTGKKNLTKEALEKKREEAQAVIDISHWKHFVSKQENLLEEANERVLENRRALSQCELEQQKTDVELRVTEQESDDLQHRKKAVDDLLSSTTSKIFQSRASLVTLKGKTSV
jgi:hypothetical protein